MTRNPTGVAVVPLLMLSASICFACPLGFARACTATEVQKAAPQRIRAGGYTIQLDYAALLSAEPKLAASEKIDRPIADPGPYDMILPGFGTAPGGRVVPSNLTLRFSFESPNAMDLMKVQWIDFDLHGTDNLGNAIPPFPATLKNAPNDLIYSAMVRPPHRSVFLQIPDERAESLRTLEGSVHVADGKVHRVVFSGKDLMPGAVKKAGPANVVLEMLYDQTDRTKINLSCYTTITFEHGDGQMDAYLGSCGREWFAVVYRDKAGKIVEPQSKALTFNADDPIVTDTHLKNGQINLAESMIPGVHGRIAVDTFIPIGKKSIGSIECYIVERRGPSKKVPFHFENVPISVPKNP